MVTSVDRVVWSGLRSYCSRSDVLSMSQSSEDEVMLHPILAMIDAKEVFPSSQERASSDHELRGVV